LKKHASCCLLAAGCATSASGEGVELYGILDAGIGYARQSGERSDVSVDSGASNDSRVGIRATETLRGGLKAKFQLESGSDLDEGTWEDQDKIFDRAAWVGLEGAFGDVRLGRQPTFTYEWFTDESPFGTDFRQASLATVFGYEEIGSRVDNAVFYTTPEFGGFQAGVGYSFNGEGPEEPGRNNRVLSVGLRYGSGPVTAAVTYERRRDADEDAAPGRADITNLSAGVTYDFDRLRLHAGYGRLQHRDFSRAASPEKAWLAGATVSLGDGELFVIYQRVTGRNENVFDVEGVRQGVALAYEYSLSKRTTLYVYGSRLRGVDTRSDDEARLADRLELGSGVRFTF
jgi:GBP family porin